VVDSTLDPAIIAETGNTIIGFPAAGHFLVAPDNLAGYALPSGLHETLFLRRNDNLVPFALRTSCKSECTPITVIALESLKDSVAASEAEQRTLEAQRDSVAREGALRARADKRRELLKRGWGRANVDAVLEGKIHIGMTAEMVRLAWGDPRSVNRTVTSAGTHEQWVYGSGYYVYFNGGLVTAIQTSEDRP
jgi:hypothetical protein